jgi:hypothetical protein
MTTIVKILITLSAVLGVLFTWVTIKHIQWKAFLEEIKAATEDGKITSDEALKLLAAFFGLFKIK